MAAKITNLVVDNPENQDFEILLRSVNNKEVAVVLRSTSEPTVDNCCIGRFVVRDGQLRFIRYREVSNVVELDMYGGIFTPILER